MSSTHQDHFTRNQEQNKHKPQSTKDIKLTNKITTVSSMQAKKRAKSAARKVKTSSNSILNFRFSQKARISLQTQNVGNKHSLRFNMSNNESQISETCLKKKNHKRSESAIANKTTNYDQKDTSSLLNRVKSIFSTKPNFYPKNDCKMKGSPDSRKLEKMTRQFKTNGKFKNNYFEEDPKIGSKNEEMFDNNNQQLKARKEEENNYGSSILSKLVNSEIQNRYHLGKKIERFIPDLRKESNRSILFKKLRDERKIRAKVRDLKEKSAKKKKRNMMKKKKNEEVTEEDFKENYRFQDYFKKNLSKKISGKKKNSRGRKKRNFTFIEDPFLVEEEELKGRLRLSETSFERDEKKNFMNGTDKFNLEEFNIDSVEEDKTKTKFENFSFFSNLKIVKLFEAKNSKIMKISSVLLKEISSFNSVIIGILSIGLISTLTKFLVEVEEIKKIETMFWNISKISENLPIDENLREIFLTALRKLKDQTLDFKKMLNVKQESDIKNEKVKRISEKKIIKFLNNLFEIFSSEEILQIFNLLSKEIILKGTPQPFYQGFDAREDEVRQLRIQILREIEVLEITFKGEIEKENFDCAINTVKSITKIFNLIFYGERKSFNQILKLTEFDIDNYEKLENIGINENESKDSLTILAKGGIGGQDQKLKSLDFFLIFSEKKIGNLVNYELPEAAPEETGPRSFIEIVKDEKKQENEFLTAEAKNKNFMANESTQETKEQKRSEKSGISSEKFKNITVSHWNPSKAKKQKKPNPLKRRLKSRGDSKKKSKKIGNESVIEKSNVTTNCTEKVNVKQFLKSNKKNINNYNIDILNSDNSDVFKSKITSTELNIEKFKKIFNTKKKGYAFKSTGANNVRNEKSALFSAPSRGIININSRKNLKFGSFIESKTESQFSQNYYLNESRIPRYHEKSQIIEESRESFQNTNTHFHKNLDPSHTQTSFLSRKQTQKSPSLREASSGGSRDKERSYYVKAETVNKINSVQRQYSTGLGGIVINKKKTSSSRSRGISSKQRLLRMNKKIHRKTDKKMGFREKVGIKHVSTFSHYSEKSREMRHRRNESMRRGKSRDMNNESVLSRGMSLTKNQFKGNGNPLKKRLRLSSKNDIEIKRTGNVSHRRSRSAKNIESFCGKFRREKDRNPYKIGAKRTHRRPKSVAVAKGEIKFFGIEEKKKIAFGDVIAGVATLVMNMGVNSEHISQLKLGRKKAYVY